MEKVIQLAPDDDIIAIKTRLEWAEARKVLMLVPRQNKDLQSLVNLKMLARTADSLNIELALVSQDLRVRDSAKQAKVKVYVSEWFARRAGFVSEDTETVAPEQSNPPQLQLVSGEIPEKKRQKRKKFTLVVGKGRLNIFQLFGLLILLGLLSASLVLSVVALAPDATITLTPQTQVITSTLSITADPSPEVTAIDRENSLIPARPVQVELTMFDEVETIDVEAAPVGFARGAVVFFNRTQNEQRIPISTTVRTSSGVPVEFVTIIEATIPAGTGATTTVPIRAVAPGRSGNVPASQINQFSNPTLGLLARVVNDRGTGGGTVELAGVVTEDDKLRLRSKLRQIIQQQGYEQLLAELGPEEYIPPESLQVIELSLSYNQFSGDVSTALGGEMRAVIRATAVNNYNLNQLAYFNLLKQVPPSYTLLPDGLQFEAGGLEEINDRAVTFPVTSKGVLVAEIDEALIQEEVAGLPIGMAQAWLAGNLPIVGVPGIDVEPNWLGRLPCFPPFALM